ncbi:MAG TPA: hypothetical protein PKE21_04755 [Flavobacteriales bacterium]|nr:hypothetical protein [Flavobacteriales bacterium]HMR26769.1 hypothetical protein [Flavobacteriales bacterium]
MHPSLKRLALPLLAGLPVWVSAQFHDPGFELNGTYYFTCPSAGFIETTTDVPPLGGDQVLSVSASAVDAADCSAYASATPFYYEELFGFPNGSVVTVSFWAKRPPNFGTGSAYYRLVFGRMTSASTYTYDQNMPGAYVLAPVTEDWAYYEHTCTVSDLDPGEALAILIGAYADSQTGAVWFDNLMIRAAGTGAVVNAAAWLDGPFDGNTLSMRSDLNTGGLIPTTEPYSALLGGPGGETVPPAVLAVTGPNAIVDWVRLELRSNIGSALPVAVRHALIQRDGDIVGTDGTSPVSFPMGRGNYYVTIRHRNHLGVVSAVPLGFTAAPANFDARSASTACATLPAPLTDAPRRTVGTARTLWAGDVTGDHVVKYTGTANDRDPILTAIGGSVPTATLSGQYRREDLNMDGVVKYAGSANDRDVILQTIGGGTPTSTRVEQVP